MKSIIILSAISIALVGARPIADGTAQSLARREPSSKDISARSAIPDDDENERELDAQDGQGNEVQDDGGFDFNNGWAEVEEQPDHYQEQTEVDRDDDPIWDGGDDKKLKARAAIPDDGDENDRELDAQDGQGHEVEQEPDWANMGAMVDLLADEPEERENDGDPIWNGNEEDDKKLKMVRRAGEDAKTEPAGRDDGKDEKDGADSGWGQQDGKDYDPEDEDDDAWKGIFMWKPWDEQKKDD